MSNYLSYKGIKRATPLRQAILVLIVATISIILLGQTSSNEEIEWFIGSSALGFFAWMNVVISFFQKEGWVRYVGQSLGLFIILSFIIYFVAQKVSTISIVNLAEYQTMLIATIVFYLCGIMVAGIIKNIAKGLGIDY